MQIDGTIPTKNDDVSKSELSDLLCDLCFGYNYELIGCCDGRSCGCQGLPVDAKPCHKCNPDGKKEPSEDWPWFFA